MKDYAKHCLVRDVLIIVLLGALVFVSMIGLRTLASNDYWEQRAISLQAGFLRGKCKCQKVVIRDMCFSGVMDLPICDRFQKESQTR